MKNTNETNEGQSARGMRVLCARCFQFYTLDAIKNYYRGGGYDEWTTPCCGARVDNDPFHAKPYHMEGSEEFRRAQEDQRAGREWNPYLPYMRPSRWMR